jgi:hypothetical protein
MGLPSDNVRGHGYAPKSETPDRTALPPVREDGRG